LWILTLFDWIGAPSAAASAPAKATPAKAEEKKKEEKPKEEEADVDMGGLFGDYWSDKARTKRSVFTNFNLISLYKTTLPYILKYALIYNIIH
jgi:hypothetical protein